MKKEEILSKAIINEMEGYSFYNSLSERIKNEVAREKLTKLARDELNHRKILEERYLELTRRKFIFPKRLKEGHLLKILKKANLSEQSDVIDVLEEAAKAEDESKSLYEKEASQAKERDVKKIFRQLAKDEIKHRILLISEKETLMSDFYWFDTVMVRQLED